jgi:Yip1 domain
MTTTESFVHLPEKVSTRDLWRWRSWLPAWVQVRAALQLQLDQVIDPWQDDAEEMAQVSTTSMRQGLGLVVVAALLAGALPFLDNWITAAQIGTALPLALWAHYAEQQSNSITAVTPFVQIWTEAVRTIAGLSPIAPGWLAAGLSALGAWVNWPLNWLTIWLVHGLGVLIAIKVQGSTATLPHFYAATSYAFAPLVLFGLQPIPYIGLLFGMVGFIWAVIIYAQGVQTLSQLSYRKVMMSLLAPVVVALLLSLITSITLALLFLLFFA